MPPIKQVLPAEKSERSTSNFVRTPFYTPCLQGIVRYTSVFRAIIGEVFTNVKVMLLCSEVCAPHK